jgi:hypothetical protein
MDTFYIVGASDLQKMDIEAIMARNKAVNIILVASFNDIKGDQVKEIESPFKNKALALLKCYDVVEEYRVFPDREDIRDKKKQFENRSRYLSRLANKR